MDITKTYQSIKQAYNFVTCLKGFHFWTNLDNLSCYVQNCFNKMGLQNIYSVLS